MTERVGVIEYIVRADLSDILSSTNALDRNLSRTERSFGQVDRAAAQVSGTLSRLSTIAISVVSALAVDRIIKYADAWTIVGNKVTNYLKDGQNLVDVQNEIFKTAQQSSTPLQAVATLYGRLEPATRGLVNSGEELMKITGTINKAFVVSGANAQESANAIVQLSQALGVGALRSEEFNSVNEQGPRIMQGIADYMGVARGELKNLAGQGKITTAVIIGAMQQMSSSVDAEFSKMNSTFEMKGTQALNNLTKSLGSNADVQKAVSTIGDVMLSLSGNIDTVVKAGEGLALLYGARLVGAMASATVETVKSAAASHATAIANSAQAESALASAAAEVRRAEAARFSITTQVGLAEASYAAAKAAGVESSAEVKLALANEASIKTQIAQIQSEKQLEIQRLKSQISSQGLIATSTRMAEVRQAEVALNARLATAEAETSAAREAAARREAAIQAELNKLKALERGARLAVTEAKVAETGATNLLAAANERASLATRTLTGVMGLLGGPTGILMIVGASIYYYINAINEAKQANVDFSSSLDTSISALEKMNEVQLVAAKYKLTEALETQTKAFKEQEEAVRKLEGQQKSLLNLPLDRVREGTYEYDRLNEVQKNLAIETEKLQSKETDLSQTRSRLYAVLQTLNGATAQNAVELRKSGNEAGFAAKMNQGLNEILKTQNEIKNAPSLMVKPIKPNSKEFDERKAQLLAQQQIEKNYGTAIAARAAEEEKARQAGITDPAEIKKLADLAEQNWKLSDSRKDGAKSAKLEASEAKKAATERENINQTLREASLETEQLRDQYSKLKIKEDGTVDSTVTLTQKSAELAAQRQLNKKAIDDDVRALAAELIAQDQLKQKYDAQIKAAQERNRLSKEFNPVGGVTTDYQKQLKDLQTYQQQVQLSEQETLAIKEGLNYQYEQNRLAAAETYFAAQSAGNAFMMDSLNALGSASTSALSGLLSGTMSVTEAMQNFANVILNQAVGALVEVGLNYVKNMILADTMAAAEKARQAASGAALAASVTAQVGMTTALAAQAAFASTAAIPIVGPAAAPAAAGAAATAAQALGSPAIPLASIAGARRYGGPVNPGSLYKVNEGGAPEMFKSGADQYMLANSRGEVVSNSDATNSGSGVTINVNNSIADTASVSTSYDEASKTVTLAINAVAQQLASRTGPVSKGLAAGWNVNGRTA